MAPSLQLRFLLSADKLEALPDSPAEVAFVGRSNVGKSSLVNALGGSKALAKVSKTPGRTRLLNCFEVEGGKATAVDCPGYGYAKASHTERRAWQGMAERYLLEREPLTMILILVDGEIGPTKLDLQMLEWVRAEELPHTIIATKHDKVRSAAKDKRKREVAEACLLEPGDVIWVSSAKGTNLDRLRGLIRLWLELD